MLISCSGDACKADFDAMVRDAGADAVWGKPFPNAVNGEMREILRELLQANGKLA